jgi:hypothetical protein
MGLTTSGRLGTESIQMIRSFALLYSPAGQPSCLDIHRRSPAGDPVGTCALRIIQVAWQEVAPSGSHGAKATIGVESAASR